MIDAHQHVGSLGAASFDEEWAQRDLTERRARMREHGIDRCVAIPSPSSAGGFRNVDHAAMNDSIVRYAKLGSEVVEAAVATVNPAEPELACDEMVRAFTKLDMPSVAFHHRFLGMQLNDSRMDRLLAVANEYGRSVFIHIVADSALEAPWRLFALAKRFTSVRFLALDGFSNPMQGMMLCEQAPDVPNVWFDTACMSSVAHQVERFIEVCGPERLVLGTDSYSYPLFRRAFPIIELGAMGLPVEDLSKILSENIRSLLKVE